MSEWKDPMQMVVAEYEARLDAARKRIAELEANQWIPLEDGVYHTGLYLISLSDNTTTEMATLIELDGNNIELGADMAVCRKGESQ